MAPARCNAVEVAFNNWQRREIFVKIKYDKMLRAHHIFPLPTILGAQKLGNMILRKIPGAFPGVTADIPVRAPSHGVQTI